MARRLVWRHRIRVKLDCSFAPMVFWHRPSAKAAAFFGVQGCVGGDVLAAVQPEGSFTGCSFTSRAAADARIPGAMTQAWSGGFEEFRESVARAPEPCASCEYLSLCRGGCRAVGTPDPGCPRVQQHRARRTLPVVST
jgi:radical SAM protein with 4Fe4S-binding SPASM domain